MTTHQMQQNRKLFLAATAERAEQKGNVMGLLQRLGTGQGYLKAGFLGFNKSGKSWTAALLACGSWKYFGKQGRIAIFDTEQGSEYLVPLIVKETGQEPLGIRARSFGDLMEVTSELQQGDIFMVDSITHPWRELCDAYLEQVNEARAKKKMPRRTRLEFQDWAPIKAKWATWTDWYLNSQVHVIICGRAGFEYENEVNDETGKRELQKVGIKMKTEGEFGFEPSLLVEMERDHQPGDLAKIVRRATVIGDRFGVIDGATCTNPTFAFFEPHLKMLKPGAHAPVAVDLKTDMQVDENGDAEFQRNRRERTILCEEITGTLTASYPSQTGADKLARQTLLDKAFQTFSWSKVESLDVEKLRRGLEQIRATLAPKSDDAEQSTEEKVFKSLPISARITAFGKFKEQLMASYGPAGESEYRRILRNHGVEKSNQFKDSATAWICYAEMSETLEKLKKSLSADDGVEEIPAPALSEA
jgi:hypothetical protein